MVFVLMGSGSAAILLINAGTNGHLEVVKLVMAAETDPYARHASGATPVSIAREKKNLNISSAAGK